MLVYMENTWEKLDKMVVVATLLSGVLLTVYVVNVSNSRGTFR